MSDDPKQRALDRLLAMVDKACSVIESSLDNERVARGQATRSADAWRVIEAVLSAPDESEQAKPDAEGGGTADDLATRREALKQALRHRRSEAK